MKRCVYVRACVRARACVCMIYQFFLLIPSPHPPPETLPVQGGTPNHGPDSTSSGSAGFFNSRPHFGCTGAQAAAERTITITTTVTAGTHHQSATSAGGFTRKQARKRQYLIRR